MIFESLQGCSRKERTDAFVPYNAMEGPDGASREDECFGKPAEKKRFWTATRE
jgi:hypothetical protein